MKKRELREKLRLSEIKQPTSNVVPSFAGYLISCISSSVSMALSIGPPVVIPFMLFGGFFLNNE